MTRCRGCVHVHGRVVRDGGDDDVWVCVFGYGAMGVWLGGVKVHVWAVVVWGCGCGCVV